MMESVMMGNAALTMDRILIERPWDITAAVWTMHLVCFFVVFIIIYWCYSALAAPAIRARYLQHQLTTAAAEDAQKERVRRMLEPEAAS